MESKGESGDRPHEPVPLRAASDPLYVIPAALSRGALALITRAYGEREVLVSDIIPPASRQVVALHAVEKHLVGCYAMTCAVAQGWLGTHARRSTVTAASA